jgi:hypothetical protein
MIERTQRRLRQARFFYQHLVNQQAKGDPETFRFYFSAFIQSARTVTWTLKNEETKKWKAWEPKWADNRSDEEKKLLGITNELRKAEEKQGGADLTMELEEIAVEALLDAIPPRRRRGVNAAYIRNLRRQSHGASVKLMQPVHYYKDGKQEITTLCRRYLEVLEKVVKDFCADKNSSAGND